MSESKDLRHEDHQPESETQCDKHYLGEWTTEKIVSMFYIVRMNMLWSIYFIGHPLNVCPIGRAEKL